MKPTDPNWHSFVAAPVVVENADDYVWDDRADVAAASLPSNHYMCGFAIADCIFTGRKAARAIAPT